MVMHQTKLRFSFPELDGDQRMKELIGDVPVAVEI